MKFTKIFIPLLACVFLVAVVSCEKDAIGEKTSDYVAFNSTSFKTLVKDGASGNIIKVPVKHSNVLMESKANVVFKNISVPENAITLVSPGVVFDKDKAAYVELSVDMSKISQCKNYEFQLDIEDGEMPVLATGYYTKVSFSKFVPIDLNLFTGTLSFTSEFLGKTNPVSITRDGSNLIVANMYQDGIDIKLEIDTDKLTVAVAAQPAWEHGDYGTVYVEGAGTISTCDGLISLTLDHHVPGLGSFGEFVETLAIVSK